MRHFAAFLLVSLALAAGCAKPPVQAARRDPDDFFQSEWPRPADEWTITETSVDKPADAFVGGGWSGLRVAADGTTPAPEGSVNTHWPPFRFEWSAEGVRLDPHLGTDYSQTLDMRAGTLTTKWRQQVKDVTIQIETATGMYRAVVGQRWKFTSDRALEVSTPFEARLFVVEGEQSVKDRQLTVAASPNGRTIEISYAWLMNSASPDAIKVSSSKNSERAESAIVIEGPAADQQILRSFLYYLRALYGDGPSNRFSPFGASSELYRESTFWDADCWMLPAVALFEPETARAFSRMRYQMSKEEVYNDWVRAGRPTATGVLGPGQMYPPGVGPHKSAWQSDWRGHEVSEEPTRFEEHVSGDVAWGLDFAANLGLIDRSKADGVIARVAQYYMERGRQRADGKFGIPDVVSVDEWHTGDDCTYTNAVADWTIRKALGEDRWPQGSMYFARDEKGLLAYQGDTRRAYQQASALLLLWPLEREDLVDDPVALLDLFQGKAATTGPAMSASVEALLRARYGDPQRAYTRWLESWQWYVRGNPFLLFSEKPGRPERTYFGTGAAGCLNAVIYGFAGARIVDDASGDSAKIAVADGKWLVFRPNLPRQWRALTLKGVTVMGKRYTVRCVGISASVAQS